MVLCGSVDEGQPSLLLMYPCMLLLQYYAAAGKRTCLLLQSVDDYAETLLGSPVSSSEFTPLPVPSGGGGSLCALRLETTKVCMNALVAGFDPDTLSPA